MRWRALGGGAGHHGGGSSALRPVLALGPGRGDDRRRHGALALSGLLARAQRCF